MDANLFKENFPMKTKLKIDKYENTQSLYYWSNNFQLWKQHEQSLRVTQSQKRQHKLKSNSQEQEFGNIKEKGTENLDKICKILLFGWVWASFFMLRTF